MPNQHRTTNLAQQHRFYQAQQASNSAAASGGGSAPPASGGSSGGGPPMSGGFTNPYNLTPTEKISRNRKQFKKFVEQVRINGITESIKFVEYNGEKYVVDGHHRLRAAKVLGINNIPIEEVKLPYKGYRNVHDLLNYFGP